jgi:ribosomal-protein-alanine N-acetyltransferase
LPTRPLETERLLLRPYGLEDLDAMAAMYADPEVTAYTKLGRQDGAQAVAILREYVELWGTHDFGMWALLHKPDLRFVGECGLFLLASGEAALRYALARSAWGKGFTIEAVRAVIDHAFRRTPLPSLNSIVQKRNGASMQVMRRLGWRLVRSGNPGPAETAIFELQRAEWEATQPR